MSEFYLGRRSLANLEGVHPDMADVVKLAITICKVDFGVTEGVRTFKRQLELFNQEPPVTSTMNSAHFVNEYTSCGHAVDLYCRDDEGNVTWEHSWFRWVIQAMFTAAIQLGHQIIAGGLWRTFIDSPHFELNGEYYVR